MSTSAPIDVGVRQRRLVEARDDVAGRGNGGDRRRDARHVRVRQTDPQVETERTGDLLAEERADRATRRASHELTDQVTEREGVVPVSRSGLPERLLLGEPSGDQVPVEVAILGDRVAERGETGLVREQHADRHPVLAVRRELGPVLADAPVERQLSPRHEHVRAQRRRTLGARPDDPDRVALPRAARRRIGDTAPEVDDRFAGERDAHRAADLAPFGEVAVELVPHSGEPGVADPLGHRNSYSWSTCGTSARRPSSRADELEVGCHVTSVVARVPTCRMPLFGISYPGVRSSLHGDDSEATARERERGVDPHLMEHGRVLVVEDDTHVRDAVARALRLEGYDVHTAVDGNDGLRIIEELGPDAIVLDVLMPGTDGLAVCRILRDRGNRTPTLMLTARHEVSDRVAGLDAGADDYLVKPFALDELLARLRALLRRASVTGGAEVLRVGTLTLDPQRRQVWRNDEELSLTKTEFDLLELLMFNAGIVVSRETIYERIWGFDFETSSKSLDVYIGYLRRKTELDGEPRIIHTVRGVGYTARAT